MQVFFRAFFSECAVFLVCSCILSGLAAPKSHTPSHALCATPVFATLSVTFPVTRPIRTLHRVNRLLLVAAPFDVVFKHHRRCCVPDIAPRHMSFRCLNLRLVLCLMRNCTLNMQQHVFPVDISPLQPEHFLKPQRMQRPNDQIRPVRLKAIPTTLITTTTEELKSKQNGCLPQNSEKHP